MKSENHPNQINPNELGKKEPAKQIKSQEKIDIKESGFGREQSQHPADEHIESKLSQIDDETTKIHHSSYEINDTDVRDQNDSTTDWDAENSRTGRHK